MLLLKDDGSARCRKTIHETKNNLQKKRNDCITISNELIAANEEIKILTSENIQLKETLKISKKLTYKDIQENDLESQCLEH